MPRDDLIARSLNDLGNAAWFGGALMGATAVGRAAADLDDPAARGTAVHGVWRRWRPWTAAAIGANLVGGALVTIGNRERLVAQRGVLTLSLVKAAITVAAVGATAHAGRLGRRIDAAGDVPIGDGASPVVATTPDVASALRQLRVVHWVVPALTGVLVVLNAAQGEQQRPSHVGRGVLQRVRPGA